MTALKRSATERERRSNKTDLRRNDKRTAARWGSICRRRLTAAIANVALHSTLSSSRWRTGMSYDLEQFITDCRSFLKIDPGPKGRERVRAHLERLLDNPDFVRAY